MCGIAGIHRRTDRPTPKVARLCRELLLAIESRGYDSTGYLTVGDDGTVHVERMVGDASKFVRRARVNGQPRTVLLHTRWATVGAVNVRNAHPVRNGTIAAVHNGTITNDVEVFELLGRERNAQVDSEAIPAVIAHHGWNKAQTALGWLAGGMAAAIIDEDSPGEVLLARTRHYPLVALVRSDLVVWASTRNAVEQAWKRTYGGVPTGQWVNLPEWSSMTVNGTVKFGRITAKPVPRRKQPVLKSYRTARPDPKLSRTVPVVVARDPYGWKPERDLFTEQAVVDLMRWASMNRSDAEEAVYGGRY